LVKKTNERRKKWTSIQTKGNTFQNGEGKETSRKKKNNKKFKEMGIK